MSFRGGHRLCRRRTGRVPGLASSFGPGGIGAGVRSDILCQVGPRLCRSHPLSKHQSHPKTAVMDLFVFVACLPGSAPTKRSPGSIRKRIEGGFWDRKRVSAKLYCCYATGGGNQVWQVMIREIRSLVSMYRRYHLKVWLISSNSLKGVAMSSFVRKLRESS